MTWFLFIFNNIFHFIAHINYSVARRIQIWLGVCFPATKKGCKPETSINNNSLWNLVGGEGSGAGHARDASFGRRWANIGWREQAGGSERGSEFDRMKWFADRGRSSAIKSQLSAHNRCTSHCIPHNLIDQTSKSTNVQRAPRRTGKKEQNAFHEPCLRYLVAKLGALTQPNSDPSAECQLQ